MTSIEEVVHVWMPIELEAFAKHGADIHGVAGAMRTWRYLIGHFISPQFVVAPPVAPRADTWCSISMPILVPSLGAFPRIASILQNPKRGGVGRWWREFGPFGHSRTAVPRNVANLDSGPGTGVQVNTLYRLVFGTRERGPITWLCL